MIQLLARMVSETATTLKTTAEPSIIAYLAVFSILFTIGAFAYMLWCAAKTDYERMA